MSKSRTLTQYPNYGFRKVATTAIGGTGVEDGANTWSRILSGTTPEGDYKDFSFKLQVMGSNSNSPSTAEITVSLRQNIAGIVEAQSAIVVESLNGSDLVADSFKVVSPAAANGSAYELWMKKATNYCYFEIYENGQRRNGFDAPTYDTNSAWQSTTPVGTVEVISTAAAPPTTLNYFTEARDASGVNVTIPAHSFTSLGAETDIDFIVQPKGQGALLGRIPDGTATGGDKRGTYAVDLQVGVNALSTAVASGSYSTISGGVDNRAAGNYSTVSGGRDNRSAGGSAVVIGGGQSNGNDGDYSVIGGGNGNSCSSLSDYSVIGGGFGNSGTANYASIGGGASNIVTAVYGAILGGGFNEVNGINSAVLGGETNIVNENYSAIIGGFQNTVDGGYSTCLGGANGTDRGQNSKIFFSNTNWGSTKEGQIAINFLATRTTDATARTMSTNGGSVTAVGHTIVMPDNSVFGLDGTLSAIDEATGEVSVWKITAAAKRGVGAGTVVIVGTPTITVVGQEAGASAWTVSAYADTTYGGVSLQVTGEVGKNIDWTANIHTSEIG